MTQHVSHRHSDEIQELRAANERLTWAVRDAHVLIDNDLVIPWIMAHKLDDILGIGLPPAPIFNPPGCICPPTSEQTCQNPLCPRKLPKM